MKGKLPLNFYVDVPSEMLPFDETVQIVYIVGWFCGTSYRVIQWCHDWPTAVAVSEDSQHDCVIHKLNLTLQKLA